MRIKKNAAGRYVDRDTGKFVSREVYAPIVARQAAYGAFSGAHGLRHKKAVQTIMNNTGEDQKVVKERYIDWLQNHYLFKKNTTKDLEKAGLIAPGEGESGFSDYMYPK